MIINGNAQSLPLADNSVDTIVTDPPYELGFMGKRWDASGVAFDPATWAEALRVAKPGAFLLAFGGTRTWHRLACAIEDAEWVIRDCLMWMYSTGFPKSHDISKAIDKAAGAEREVVGSKGTWKPSGNTYAQDAWSKSEHDMPITTPSTPLAQLWDGWGTALAPSWEPIIVAMKPLDGTFAQNAERHGVAGLWIDGGRVGTEGGGTQCSNRGPDGKCLGHPDRRGTAFGLTYHSDNYSAGRWPPNCILDEHAAGLLDEQSGVLVSGAIKAGQPSGSTFSIGGELMKRPAQPRSIPGDSGGASRFFKVIEPDTRFRYVSKPSRAERNAGLAGRSTSRWNDGRKQEDKDFPSHRGATDRTNPHPTVKPVALMRYLVRLTRTPTGGIVLDPFCGSGTTGMACELEDRDFVGVDLNPDYCELARARIAHVKKHGTDWKADPRQVALDAQMDLLT